MGCAVVHDHPGIRSDAWYAVAFPGGSRLDMGLVDCVLLAVIAVVYSCWRGGSSRRASSWGYSPMSFSVPRFFLDFLRAKDLSFVDGRMLGLTPAQSITPVLAALGVYLLVPSRRASPVEPAPRTTPVETA